MRCPASQHMVNHGYRWTDIRRWKFALGKIRLIRISFCNVVSRVSTWLCVLIFRIALCMSKYYNAVIACSEVDAAQIETDSCGCDSVDFKFTVYFMYACTNCVAFILVSTRV